MNFYEYFILLRRRLFDLLELKNIRRPVPCVKNCFHLNVLSRAWRRVRGLVPAPAPALPETFAFFRRHLIPAFRHAFAEVVARTAAMGAEPAEQDPAQCQQPQRLPERDRTEPEQRRRQPVPQ